MKPVLKRIENIEVVTDKYADNGLAVTVINPVTKQGVGMHLRYVTPNALRKLADFLEEYTAS